MEIKFIGYNGEYPNLCFGVLVIEINGKTYRLNSILRSGGCITQCENGDYIVETGEWGIIGEIEWKERKLPDELIPYRKQIEQLANENITHGCCGGCV